MRQRVLRILVWATAIPVSLAASSTSGSGPADPALQWIRVRLGEGGENAAQVLEDAAALFRISRVDLALRMGRECAEEEAVEPYVLLLAGFPQEELRDRRDGVRRAALVERERHAEWSAALQAALVRASEDPGKLLLAELQEGNAELLLQSMHLVQDPGFFDAIYPVLRSVAPGGWLSFRHPVEVQRAALGLLHRSSAQRDDALALLRRVARLSGDPESKEIAREALAELDPGADSEAVGGVAAAAGSGAGPDPEVMARGKEVYMRPGLCATCHLPNGSGMLGAFPPLVKSPWMGGDPDRMIKAVHGGLMGNIEINGEWFNNVMPPQGLLLNDQELAAVLTYVRNSWGNSASVITPDMVRRVKEESRGKVGMWTVDELLKAHPLEEESEEGSEPGVP